MGFLDICLEKWIYIFRLWRYPPHEQLFLQFWSYWPNFFCICSHLIRRWELFKEKKFCSHSVWFFWKNADVSKNLKTRFLINVKSYKAEIWSTRSLGNYLYFVTSIFEKKIFSGFYGQKSNFSIFEKKWRHKNGQKLSKNYFFQKSIWQSRDKYPGNILSKF